MWKGLSILTRSTSRLLTSRVITVNRNATTTATGAFYSQPRKTPFGLFGILCTVTPGLFIGAAISRNIASFLEENDLFVPSDDDDDDD